MKLHGAFLAFAAFLLVDADIYMHNPRGSNNRLNENSANRRNANRVFDSQNNNRGGYNIGDKGDKAAGNDYNKQYRMHYIMSPENPTHGESFMPIEWTNQHGCGENNDTEPAKCNCNIVIQMLCQPDDVTNNEMMRDGTNTGTQPYRNPTKNERYSSYLSRKRAPRTILALHESFDWYDKCVTRKRNRGLFTADQKLKSDASIYTRQNPNGNRRGYECPEERDYYPYWHPTEWKDIKVLAERADRCDFYKKNSFNTATKWECVERWIDTKEPKHYSQHNNKMDCENKGGVWTEFHNYLEILENVNEADCKLKNYTWGLGIFQTRKKCLVPLPPVECEASSFSRVNHLGNGEDLEPLRIQWKIPHFPSKKSQKCVIRIRYNISTDDYNVEKPILPRTYVKTFDEKDSAVLLSSHDRTLLKRPPRNSHGYMYYGEIDRPPFKKGEYFTFEKMVFRQFGRSHYGWRCDACAEQYIEYSFSIFFEESVPPPSHDFGLKVRGSLYNDWVSSCQPDQWCHVKGAVGNINKHGGSNDVSLHFNSITDRRRIHFTNFTFDLYKYGKLIENDPQVDLGSNVKLQLAINTAQFGRTFEDRSHVSILEYQDGIFKEGGGNLYAVQVRGKRGNIVQTFPAVEYDFVPKNLSVNKKDMVHFQWTGSNTHNNGAPGGDGQTGDAGQGTDGTDRSNIVSLKSLDQSFPALSDDDDSLCENIDEVVYSKFKLNSDVSKRRDDACVQLMSSGYHQCIKRFNGCTNPLVGGNKMNNLLNNAPASFPGLVVKFKKGTYHYLCSRNNAFTNRAQKATIEVK